MTTSSLLGRGAVVALALSSLLLVACNKLDHAAVEGVIEQSMQSKGHPMKSVSCPAGELKEQTITCTGVDNGGKNLDFKVTIKPTSGGKADIRYSTVADGKPFSN